MGGGAFGSGADAPFTPRMPTDVYRKVRDNCHTALRQIFTYVATPIEGPGKKDHGDIDVLVAGERRLEFPRGAQDTEPRSMPDLFAAIKDVLGADHSNIVGNAGNLAIPWPAEFQPEEDDQPRHIQVDVRVCKDFDDLTWRLFKHAHGDIWNILGSTIRPFGLTLDEDAMWLRIPEIEKIDKKKSKVFLSSDPAEVLHFLGLEVEGYWTEPFPSVQDLFEYATTCRFFWVSPTAEHDDIADLGPDGDEGKKKLKSNDRRRMRFRPIFRVWIEEYIPALRAEKKFIPKNGTPPQTRDTVRDQAFSWFHIEQEYEGRVREWRSKRSVDEMKKFLKGIIPTDLENNYRATLTGALRKIIIEGDQTFGVTLPGTMRDRYGVFDKEMVRDFVQQNLEEVGDKAWERQCQRAREAMEAKGKLGAS
ncbi:hypothetical protein QBC39DRAFT_359737 [Podospora conica]|nr:hypothetical protein QBC39DRAFT_359737 [Schizothecium conicum]